MIRGSFWVGLGAVVAIACSSAVFPPDPDDVSPPPGPDDGAGAAGAAPEQHTKQNSATPVMTGGEGGAAPERELAGSGGQAPDTSAGGRSTDQAGNPGSGASGRAGGHSGGSASGGAQSGGTGGAASSAAGSVARGGSSGSMSQAGAPSHAGAPPTCECSTGQCCDGCHARPATYSCGTNLVRAAVCIGPKYEIADGVGRQYGNLFCDGISTGACGRWVDTTYVASDCPANQRCSWMVDNQAYCEPL